MPRYRATPLFNAIHDVTPRDEVPIINGQRYSPYMDGWVEGVPLKPSMIGIMAVDAQDERSAAEAVFMALNADSRPNGKVEPSLSVGDVVVIHTSDSDVPFSVQFIGFRAENMFEVDEAIIRH